MMIIKKTGRKFLYLKFFDNLKNKMIERSTGLVDTPESREELEKIVIPEIQKRLKSYPPKPTNQTKKLEDYVNIYLKSKENLATYCDVESKSKLMLEHFGNVEVKTITPLDCKNYILNLTMATKTKRNYLNVLKGIFDVVCEDLAISENPTRYIKLIKTQEELEQDDVQPFSREEKELLLNDATGKLKDFLGISFYTGARPGELLGLKIQDIDFEKNTISITKQFTKRILKKTLKTEVSRRVIPLFAAAIPYFQNLIKEAKINKSFYLFSKDGEPTSLYSIDNIRGKKGSGIWSRLLKKCKIEYRKIYQTRHTFITHALNSGNLKVMDIAQIVGHNGPEMIYKTYGKFIKGEQLKIDRKIDIFDAVDTQVDSRHFENKIIFEKMA